MPEFVEKWVFDSARDRHTKEISLINSEWPAHSTSGVASGYRYPDAGSASILLAVPSSRWFKPQTVWVTNLGNAADRVALYVGGSAASCDATIQHLWVQAQETVIGELKGITVGGDIYASGYLGSTLIRVAGILMQSGPEN